MELEDEDRDVIVLYHRVNSAGRERLRIFLQSMVVTSPQSTASPLASHSASRTNNRRRSRVAQQYGERSSRRGRRKPRRRLGRAAEADEEESSEEEEGEEVMELEDEDRDVIVLYHRVNSAGRERLRIFLQSMVVTSPQSTASPTPSQSELDSSSPPPPLSSSAVAAELKRQIEALQEQLKLISGATSPTSLTLPGAVDDDAGVSEEGKRESTLASLVHLAAFADTERILDGLELDRAFDIIPTRTTVFRPCGAYNNFETFFGDRTRFRLLQQLPQTRLACSIINTFDGASILLRHWMAVLINMEDKKLYIVDPLAAGYLHKSIITECFEAFLTNFKIDWTVQFISLDVQRDSFNCGIFSPCTSVRSSTSSRVRCLFVRCSLAVASRSLMHEGRCLRLCIRTWLSSLWWRRSQSLSRRW